MPSRAGRPNKNKQFLMNRLADMYGDDFHPIMNMAENAVTLQKRVKTLGEEASNSDLLDANKAWAEIAKYVEPQLKAVEVQAVVTVDEDALENIEKLSELLGNHGIDLEFL